MISHRYHGSVKLFFLLKQAGGYLIFWAIVWLLHLTYHGNRLDPSMYVWLSLMVPAAGILEKRMRAGNRRSLCGLTREQISNITQREIIFTLVFFFGLIVLTKDPFASRIFLVLFFVAHASWITWMNFVGHRAIQKLLYRNREKGMTQTIVLASRKEIELNRAHQMETNLPGTQFMGYVAFGGSPSEAALSMSSLPVLGEFRDLSRICKEYGARMLLTAGIEDRPSLVQSLQKMCDAYGMRLVWVDDKQEKFRGRLDAVQDGSRVFLTSWSEPLEDPVARLLKRLTDVSFSLLIAATIFPLLCLGVWILHRLYSPGPLFYHQKRTGRNGEIFEVLKFRSMHVNDTAGRQAQVGDSRIFKGGNFLRRTSLDEIPQFINVLKGQMSVVGPRPHFVDHDEEFEKIVEDYPIRFFGKPGITGLAQVNGCRGETETELKVRQRVRLDNFYLRNWSMWLDACIITRTAFQVLFPPSSAR